MRGDGSFFFDVMPDIQIGPVTSDVGRGMNVTQFLAAGHISSYVNKVDIKFYTLCLYPNRLDLPPKVEEIEPQ